MHKLAIVLFAVGLTYVLLTGLSLVMGIKHKELDVAPFSTVIDYWCSKSGTEYIVTSQDVEALLEYDGKPVLCNPTSHD